MSLLRRARAPSARWAALLALALLWSQGVGLLHGIAHAPHGAPAASAPAPAGLDGLFALHDEVSAACQVFDATTHGAALWGVGPAFAAPPPSVEVPVATIALPLLAAKVHFLARAPPRHT